MKKLTFKLCAIFILLLTVSCSSDDNDDSSNSSLEGTWKLTAWISTNAHDLNNDGTASTNLLKEFDCLNNETLVFSEGNIATAFSTSYVDIEVNIVIGTTNEYVFNTGCGLDSDSYSLTYTQNGNTIVINDEGDLMTATLSGNQMSFVISEGFEAYNSDTFESEILEDLTIVYTKQ